MFRRDRGGLGELSDDELGERYGAVQLGIAGEDPQGRAAEVERVAAEIVRRHPDDRRTFLYDLGMFAKWRRDWPASAEYNRRALDLIPPERRRGEPAAWNLGIAATALRDWATARRAWTAFGLPLTQVDDPAAPVVENFGVAPVRLNAGPRFVGQRPLELEGQVHDTEVVWGRRLCPTRVLVVSVPTPELGHRCGDVVLHDGDPVGTRMLGEREVSVFNEIELWERSPVPTLTASVEAPEPAAVEALTTLFDEAGGAAEDWTANLQLLCRASSEGRPGDDPGHDHAPGRGWALRRRVGISAREDEARALLDRWAAADAGRSYADLGTALR
jgi:hypothetical protein